MVESKYVSPPFHTTISHDSNACLSKKKKNACHSVVGKMANNTSQIDSISYLQNQDAEKFFRMCKKKVLVRQ